MALKYIREEAHYLVKKVISLSYNCLSSDEFLKILKDLNDSSIRRNKEVFSCIIFKLLDEQTHFPGYSYDVLMKLANIYGGLIEYELISDPETLKNTLQLVMDTLKNKPDSRMFDFGVTALNRFYERLWGDCEEYFQSVAAIPHLKSFPRHIIEWIEDHGKHTPERAYDGPTGAQQSSVVLCSPTGLSAVKTQSVDLEEFDFEGIGESLTDKDKIVFIVNNLNAKNLREKCDEIKNILKEEHVPWLSEYLIEQRVRFEFNLHALYSDFLDRMNNEKLNALVMSRTIENIQMLLDSNTTNSRALLKNFGHWLGIITLAKNIPLPFYDGYLNSLLTKAVYKGIERLTCIVPFIAKILVACAKSKVFEPKSLWTLNLLRSLAELHKQPGLKLNIQFEIEILFKSLNIELGDLKSGQI
ncbi:CCR4-NOT transcription complex subunit 1-like [Sipha flava]|uniref:CCR4-NOT transcription complex subunit 1-like n=1 Tax=Sipha flava TaxID=143950 RepID=A0A8B8GE98_9HEMI|nr:CCR4-NOT transcription complex subunit 1-like [Sipha flava]